MPAATRAAGDNPEDLRALVEAFLKGCKEPALLEPGEELFPLAADNFALEIRGARLTLQAWDRTRNLTRRLVTIKGETGGRMELAVERFPKRQGAMYLLDLARRSGAELGRRSDRLVFRERFRLFLRRQFPEWTLAEISAETNLEYSLSPSFPRAFLRHGQHGWAAIACPPGADSGAVLTFGLIWLSHLRARERRVAIEGLAIYLPAGEERSTALRLLCLDPAAARFALYTYTPRDQIAGVDPRDRGNIDTRLDPCRRAEPNRDHPWRRIAALPASVEIDRASRRACEPARARRGIRNPRGLPICISACTSATPPRSATFPKSSGWSKNWHAPGPPTVKAASILCIASSPRAWLESQARAHLDVIDASLERDHVYGQVPAFAGGERGILDLLAVDYSGRLAVVELKASADIHLPLQALDYWIRVEWHLARGEFSANGYFPGMELRTEALEAAAGLAIVGNSIQ